MPAKPKFWPNFECRVMACITLPTSYAETIIWYAHRYRFTEVDYCRWLFEHNAGGLGAGLQTLFRNWTADRYHLQRQICKASGRWKNGQNSWACKSKQWSLQVDEPLLSFYAAWRVYVQPHTRFSALLVLQATWWIRTSLPYICTETTKKRMKS